MAFLQGTKGPDSGVVCQLHAGINVLGRDARRCNVVLRHHLVSREHARLDILPDGAFLEDLNSRNGVLVNGVPLRPGPPGRIRLQPMDRIEIAPFEFSFHDLTSADTIRISADARENPRILSTVDVSSRTSREFFRQSFDADTVRDLDATVTTSREQTHFGGTTELPNTTLGTTGSGIQGNALRKLLAVLQIIEDTSGRRNPETVPDHILDCLFRVFPGCESGCLLLPRGDGEFYISAVKNVGESFAPPRLSRSVVEYVAKHQQAVLSGDDGDGAFELSNSARRLKVRSVMYAPLIDAEGLVIGVLELETSRTRDFFTHDDLHIVAGVARHLAVVFENARLHTAELRAQKTQYEHRFRQLIEQSIHGVLIHREWEPLFVNRAWANLHGLAPEEVLDLDSVESLIAPPYRAAATEAAEHLQSGKIGETWGERQDLRRDGAAVWIEEFATVIEWDGGPAIQSTVIDLSERKRTEQVLRESRDELEQRVLERTAELQRSNRDLEQFAYSVSHDLQSPLRTVASYCQLLQREHGEMIGETGREYVASAIEGTRRMRRLLDDLLAYSRATSGPRESTAVNLEQVVGEALRNLAASIRENHAIVTHDTLPTVTGDRTQLMQLLQNLINNALTYRRDIEPRIHIGVEDDGTHWTFSVRDNGEGIDPRDFERIFQLFQRLTTEDRRPGTGIGLSICQRIVQRHGGQIRVESKKGEGSTFLFTLPKSR